MSDFKQKEIYRFLILAAIVVAIGFQGWRTLFNNFAVENVGVT